jgi:hypothetical protein
LRKLTYTRGLRRLFSLAILWVMLAPMISPLLLGAMQNSDAGLPACCRKDGKHHCTMTAVQRASLVSGLKNGFTAPAENCPYTPRFLVQSHQAQFALDTSQSVFAGVASHPAAFPQTQAKYRISFRNSRQKRGPPVASL